MRGEVEIWRGDELISRESNLIVDGAGATIADIMTVPHSISGTTLAVPGSRQYPTASAILDASNYRVQAMSFGEDAAAYQLNAHTLPTRRNLLYYSTPSSQTDDPAGEIYWPAEMTVSAAATTIPLPSKYEGLSSGIAHALRIMDTSITVNTNLNLTVPINSETLLSTSAFDNKWFTYSAYLKSPIYDSEFYPFPFTDTVNNYFTHFKMQITGAGFSDVTELGKARASTDIYWATSGATDTPSGMGLGFSTDMRGGGLTASSEGYDPKNWDQNGGIVNAGNGWYLL